MSDILLQLENISKVFVAEHQKGKNAHHNQKILENINLSINSDEIIAIIGRSGCGKSTLLRIIAGLIEPAKGKIITPNKNSQDLRASMVFQNFALFPWLTVSENIEIGLEALNINKKERKKRILQILDLIGLDGFDAAYPRELSGGMKQRVGMARALVTEPDILILDEAFSALDVLTANNLKQDLLNIWATKKINLQSIITVTHSIEEAVLMADSIVLLAPNPGRIADTINITLPRPRDNKSAEFINIVERLYSDIAKYNAAKPQYKHTKETDQESNDIFALPAISTNKLVGMLTTIDGLVGKNTVNISQLVEMTHISISDILAIVNILSILKFIQNTGYDITLTKDGKNFVDSSVEEKKVIFAKHLLNNVPLMSYILKVLQKRHNHRVQKIRFQTYIEDYLSPEDTATTLDTIISWGRYGEIFAYDDNEQILLLEQVEPNLTS